MYETKCSVCHSAQGVLSLWFASFFLLSGVYLCTSVPGQPTDPEAVLLAPCLDAYLKSQVLQSPDIQPGVLIMLPVIHHAVRSSSFVLLRPQVLILPLAIFDLYLQTSSCSVPNL